MAKKINLILEQVLERVKPSKEEFKDIQNSLDEFLKKFEKKLKSLKIKAEVFVGGSFAKKTMIKKNYYDIDIFLRFDKKYKDISKLTKKILKGFNASLIHGSRDYFKIKISDSLFFEIVPVKKVNNPREAENITDLSYSHVKYINKKVKSKKLLDEIMIAKAFFYANNCYGAESYIKGFSGYAIELLVYYYGSFLKMIKAVSKAKEDKIIIDIEKYYRNKSIILMDVNSSKLQSPIVVIDPTYKQRNALAALSKEGFERFKKASKKFLKNPSINSFKIKKADLKKIKREADKKGYEFILIEARTGKQEGDVAGSKLLKFYKHLSNEIEKYFEIKRKGFIYSGKKSARYFFAVKNKKEILIQGPSIKSKVHVKNFKKKHKKIFIKSEKVYSRKKINFTIKEFVENWKKKHKNKIKEMKIEGFRV